MRRNAGVFALFPLLLTLVPSPAVAQNAQYPACIQCTLSPVPGREVVEIDARSLSLRTTRSKFKKGERIRIVLVNKNPYLYRYSAKVNAIPVQEKAIGKFIGFLSEDFKEKEPAKGSGKEAGLQFECAAYMEYVRRFADLRQQLERVTAAKDAADDLRKRWNSLRLSGAECAQLCSESAALLKDLAAYDPMGAPLRLAAVEAQVIADSLERTATNYRNMKVSSTNPPSPETTVCIGEAADAMAVAVLFRDTAKTYLAAIEELVKVEQGLEEAETVIASVLANSNSFNELIDDTVGGYDVATEVTIEIEQIPLDPKDTNRVKREIKLDFGGGPRLALGAGVVASTLPRVEYERVQSVVTQADGTTATVIRVGQKEDSNFRVLPMIFLHGRVWEPTPGGGAWWESVYLTLGVTVKSDDEGTGPEFLFGPSFGFVENKLFLTPGVYLGRYQSLEGGLQLGQEIPESLAELPVRNDYRAHFGFSVSYRF